MCLGVPPLPVQPETNKTASKTPVLDGTMGPFGMNAFLSISDDLIILLKLVMNRLTVGDFAQVHEGGQVDVIRNEMNAAVAKDHVEAARVRGAKTLFAIVAVAVVVVGLRQVVREARRVVVPAGGVTLVVVA